MRALGTKRGSPSCCLWLGLLAGAAIGCSDATPKVGPPCAASMLNAEVAFSGVDHIDALFVISDAPSMVEEQAVLRTRLPALMRTLVSGELEGEPLHPPLQDVRVAVVSASLADGGDFHRAPADADLGCPEQAPSFLRYRGPYFGPDRDDPDAFTDDFTCLARLGTASAAPNQPLAAAFAALADPQRAREFLRNDPADGLSLIQVVVIGDSDDCSLPRSAAGTAPPPTTAACVAQSSMLESVQHFVDGLKALRAGNENLVSFSVIAGVPPALVGAEARVSVDLYDFRAADAYYQRILDDPSMQLVADPANAGRLRPACESAHASAEPARRLIEAARAFGSNGNVLSICSDDWSFLIAPLQESFGGSRLDAVCLPRAQPRGADSLVGCKVYWDLPSPDDAPEGTPTQCSQRRYLQPAPGAAREPGGQRCEMRQLPIDDETDLAAVDPDNGGWYYDDFSEDRRRRCVGSNRARIAFTPYSTPQSGITLSLECFASQVLPNAAADAGSPDAAACGVPPFIQPLRPAPFSKGAVGQACTPANVPGDGYQDLEVHLETGAADCISGVCMVFQLHGDPRSGCTQCNPTDPSCDQRLFCAEPEEVADRIYCTCRCRAAGSDAPECACPAGFSCHDTFGLGGPGFEGGYCVKDGTFESR